VLGKQHCPALPYPAPELAVFVCHVHVLQDVQAPTKGAVVKHSTLKDFCLDRIIIRNESNESIVYAETPSHLLPHITSKAMKLSITVPEGLSAERAVSFAFEKGWTQKDTLDDEQQATVYLRRGEGYVTAYSKATPEKLFCVNRVVRRGQLLTVRPGTFTEPTAGGE